MISFKNISEAQLFWFKEILVNGNLVSCRNELTKEVYPVSFALNNPRDRITHLPNRNWSFALAFGELIWHLAASNELNFIEKYVPKWHEINQGKPLITGSCYGKKIFEPSPLLGISVWDSIINILKEDIHSRRAVIQISSENPDHSLFNPDVPCLSQIQFLIRDGKLDMLVTMRSNDLVWGLPNDVFVFTVLQEIMALELGVDLGKYCHTANSLHIYERHFDLADRIVESGNRINEFELMPAMKTPPNFKQILEIESKIRSFEIKDISQIENSIDDFWHYGFERVIGFFKRKQAQNIKV